MKMNLESEATLVREVQGTPSCRRGLRGPIGAIAPAVAAKEARGSDIVRVVTSITGNTRSVRETVYRLNLAQFHPAENIKLLAQECGRNF